jgi:hypothetical protein
MIRLNLPTYSFNIKSRSNGQYIFDGIRKKYVLLTPEEWVRQNFVSYLIQEKSYPPALIKIEQTFLFNKLNKRTDVVIHDRKAFPVMLVECKAPDVRISQKVFDQIALYNLEFSLNYLVVTNGLKHFCCYMVSKPKKAWTYLKEIPDYDQICG